MRMKRILSLFIILSIVLCSSTALSGAAIIIDTEEKTFCTATLEDAFADNQVIVAMNNATSLEFKEYTALDFPEISCSNVAGLMPSVTNIAKSALSKAEAGDMKEANTVNNSSKLDCRIDLNEYHQILCLEISNPGKQNVLAAIKALEARPDILYAEPNYIIPFCSTIVDDQHYLQQWGPNKIQLPQAWDITTGSSSVYVGVIDTGIDGAHPDLINRVNVSMSRDCRSGSAVPVPYVAHGMSPHGTLVAGVIGAAGNSIGISGVCRNVSLVSLQVDLPDTSQFTGAHMTSIVAAIDYATDTLSDDISNNDIQILNCSFGLPNISNIHLMLDAIEQYGVNGGLVVCSAGNNNEDTDGVLHYPSRLSMYEEYIISVGASTSLDQKWSGSNYGATSVNIFAPGASILSCHPEGMCINLGPECADTHFSTGYHFGSGTSLAAPFVTGVAALMLAEDPSLEATEIRNIILNNSDLITIRVPYSALDSKEMTVKRLNAYKAVLACHTHDYSYSITATADIGTCRCGATTTIAAQNILIESVPDNETE